MTPVQLLWTKPFNESNTKFESCIYMFLSAQMTKDIYGEVHILTDYYGHDIVRSLELPYDKVYTTDGYMEEMSSFVDAKIYGYKTLADILPGYLYLDYDIFITKEIEKRDIMVQCDEGENSHPFCLHKYFIDKGVNFCYEYEQEDLRFLNMGLFRCTDKKVIYDYYDSYFTTIYENKHIGMDSHDLAQYSIFLEQTYIYKTLQKHNKLDHVYEHYPRDKKAYNNYKFSAYDYKLGEIMDTYLGSENYPDRNYYMSPSDINNIDKTGYTHLMHFKQMKEVSTDVIEFAFTKYPKEFAKLMSNMKYIY
ncbi:DUF6734 family protein [Aquimarina pacifica]|uniref:DUF6734 family protein n=1 Tax=Aquimarina pacifica TaxID=1296415 RepID=UPI00046FD6D9|nr:DUF6734 family protein [Aquimarina pacifica]